MNAIEWDRAHLWHFRADLLRVIDGDTIVVLTDNGMYDRHETHVRIADLWEPELDTEEGRNRRDLLIEKLQLFLPAPQRDWSLRVVTRQKETIVSEERSFERYVGDVYVVMRNGDLFNIREAMV